MVSDLVLARWGSENVFDRPQILYKSFIYKKKKPQTIDYFINFIQTSLLYFIIMFYLMLWKVQDKLFVYSVVYSYTHLINVISLSFLTEL